MMNKLFGILIKTIFLVGLVLLSFGYYQLNLKIESLKDSSEDINEPLRQIVNQGEIRTNVIDGCGDACKDEIERLVSQAVATLSAKTNVTNVVNTSATSGTTYIPMGSTFSTFATDWTDVADSGIYIDLEKDYGKSAKVSWGTSLKVAHANGKAFARLFDDTNKIAVDFSEISTENNSTYKQVSSGNLPLWRGRNLYKVQIKSLNSFEITYSVGRIKVSY